MSQYEDNLAIYPSSLAGSGGLRRFVETLGEPAKDDG